MLIWPELVRESQTTLGEHSIFQDNGAEERSLGKHVSEYLREIAVAGKLVDWDEPDEKEEWEPRRTDGHIALKYVGVFWKSFFSEHQGFPVVPSAG